MLLTLNVCSVQEYMRHREYLVSVNFSLISVTRGTAIIHENQVKNFIRKHILSQGKTLMSFFIDRNLHYSFFGLQQNYKN